MCAPAARSVARLRSNAAPTVASRPSSISVRRHREAQVAQRSSREVDAARCEHLVQQHSVAHRARDRAGRVERRRQRNRALGRRQPRRVLEADQALQRGRDADRAAGVGAERGPGGAGGDRDRAARGRAAGDARCASSAAVAGLAGVPKCGLMPTPENANSDMLVRPMNAAPARRRRATAGQSAAAGGFSASTVEPAVVTWPWTSNKSFTLTARPASGGSAAPAARSASTSRAVAAAASKLARVNVC